MADYHVTCINKPDRLNTHEHITHIGGNANGQRWKIDRDTAIQYIDTKQHTFYTVDPASGKRADVGVRREPGKHPYLQTHADGYWNNNLLSLQECPI